MTELTRYRVVGLTGMSGAGKSTVSRVFAESGFLVIDCDRVAREVAEPNSPFLSELSQRFSQQLIKPDGTLDRPKTAALIFGDKEKRSLYNQIIYPYIAYNIIRKIKAADRDILLDAPTLFESRLCGICSEIISVCADRERCAERIMKRDSLSREQALARLSSQHTLGFFRERSDFCLENNGSERELYEGAQQIIEQLKGNK